MSQIMHDREWVHNYTVVCVCVFPHNFVKDGDGHKAKTSQSKRSRQKGNPALS